MRIKKLELCGFKSFKDRTVIHFDAGITGVVGPNGCGKSNIVDALVWVMGEQSAKHLRGSSMTDVIFGGAEGYAPSNMCEVHLTLEDDGGAFPSKYVGHSEIMITRRLFRSGESEYLINKQQARLKDIHEVFMDTGAGSKGFSIIEQGAIGKIIVAKPQDRRGLIEEAAGITKFKVRKRESTRKLQNTEQNLVRLADIVQELKRQIDSLQRQAKKAERYRLLKTELEEIELWVSAKKYLRLHAEAEEAEQIFSSIKEIEDSRVQRMEELEFLLQESTEQSSQVETELLNLQKQQDEEKEILQNKRLELQNLKFEVEQAKRKEEMTGSMSQELEARKEILDADLLELNDKLESLRKIHLETQAEFESENSRFENIDQRIQELDDQLTQERKRMLIVGQGLSTAQGSIDAYRVQHVEAEEALNEARLERQDYQEKEKEFAENHQRIQKEMEGHRQMQLDIMKDVENFQENRDVLLLQVEAKRKEVQEFKDSLNEVASRLYGLEDLQANFEGFQEGVKNVMFWHRKRQEMRADGQVDVVAELQPVSEVVSVEDEYELAMESALGSRLQMILSEDGNASLQAVEYLKSEKNGRSSFFSSEEVSDEDSLEMPAAEGVLCRLQDKVTAPEKYQKSVEKLLGRVVVVDSLKRALSLRPLYPNWNFVTKEGDLLSADGVLTGGSEESADSGILKRSREIKELSQRKEEWAGKLALSETALKKLESQLVSLEKDLEEAHKNQTEKEIKVAELKKDLERSENEWKNAQKAVERQDLKLESLKEKSQEQARKLQELEEKIAELEEEQKQLEVSVAEKDREYNETKNGVSDLQKKISDLRVQAAEKQQQVESAERQKEMLAQSLREVEVKLSSLEEESVQNNQSLSENQVLFEQEQVSIEKLAYAIDERKQKLESLKESLDVKLDELRDIEDQLQSIRKQYTDEQSSMNQAQLKLEQAKMKEGYLVEQIRERYMQELSEIAGNFKDREDPDAETESRVEELKQKLGRIGEVNLSAIQEYEETAQRYEFLSQQQEDLNNAKKELNRVIDRINRICSKRFRDTFEAVNERFQKAFPVLFGGGEAKLILVEDEEKGEMGIDIMAKPPGKKLQSVSLLSGGEKALTAVALIFSIFLVKPSPYCLLDEVDAPLDDANVFRFNELVKEMAKRSQIILVTHNKHTMEINKKLYGVTMQERGVSKMVSVNLEDAAKIAQA